MKYFTSVNDISRNQISPSAAIDQLINEALQYKQDPFRHQHLGRNRRMGLIFLNPSLRTRLSTQVAAEQLGMQAIVFNAGSEGWTWEFEEGTIMNGSTVEHIKDAAPVLSQYFDILAIRTFPGLKDRESDYAEAYLQQFIRYTTVPVISLESATLHPLQSLTDLMTIREQQLSSTPKVVLCWAPHVKPLPQCVANSFAQWMSAWDQANFVIAHPEGMDLDPKYTTGALISHDRIEAIRDADIIYIKNWSSYKDYGTMAAPQDNWMLQDQDLQYAPYAKVMHCLPVRRNVELSDAILDGPNSLVTQQAGNRVWAAQAVIAQILQQYA
ncbi:Rossmann-fold NAD(P)-binding domain-containing protein [Edaphocola flava]|uniref:acetylornithine carbamoyltransferase n=1 Tax=Edaphocola flava TaxID=2499629 RepID=UPI00100BE73B|nr:acetylornithine carbamoyltransferase [Edaphocola flava]